MRIALTADPELPVPPRHYGGIERIIDMLARSLTELGHEVTLFAHPDSRTAGSLIPWPGRSSSSKAATIQNAILLGRHVAAGSFDLVHSFSRLAYMTPILPMSIPKLMTYQREIHRGSVVKAHWLARGTLTFSAISRDMMKSVADVGTWRLVYNGVPLKNFDMQQRVTEDAPLVFLGRLEEIKGPHIAIEVARRLGIPLVLAGNVAREHDSWFEQHIVPHLNGSSITYVGAVDDEAKNVLLGRARALLMPILVGSSRVDLQACKLEYSIVSPK